MLETLKKLFDILDNFDLSKWLSDITTKGYILGLDTAKKDIKFDGNLEPDMGAIVRIGMRAHALSEKAIAQAKGSLAHNADKLYQEMDAAVKAGMDENEALKQIQGRVRNLFKDSYQDWELERLVRDQFLVATKEGRRAGWQQGGVPYRMWQAHFDNKTAADSKRMHGQIVRIDEPYTDSMTGEKYMLPHMRPNDRCYEKPLWELPEDEEIHKRKKINCLDSYEDIFGEKSIKKGGPGSGIRGHTTWKDKQKVIRQLEYFFGDKKNYKTFRAQGGIEVLEAMHSLYGDRLTNELERGVLLYDSSILPFHFAAGADTTIEGKPILFFRDKTMLGKKTKSDLKSLFAHEFGHVAFETLTNMKAHVSGEHTPDIGIIEGLAILHSKILEVHHNESPKYRNYGAKTFDILKLYAKETGSTVPEVFLSLGLKVEKKQRIENINKFLGFASKVFPLLQPMPKKYFIHTTEEFHKMMKDYTKHGSFNKGGVGSGIKGHRTYGVGPDKAHKRIKAFEDQIRTAPVEHLLAVNEEGKVLFETTGNKNSCLIPWEVGHQIEKEKGIITTHNHPTGKSFSRDDIHIFLILKEKEVRAVGKDYTYVMTRVEGSVDNAVLLADKVWLQLYNEYNLKVCSEGMDPHEAGMQHYHRLWTEVAKKIQGLEYHRTKNKDIKKGGPGSGIKGHRTYRDDLNRAHKKITDFEDEMKYKPIECCLFVDGKGKSILQKTGTENSITLSELEVEKIKHEKDVIWSHNHPRGTPLSKQDIFLTLILGAKEARATGSQYTYIVTYGKDRPNLLELSGMYTINYNYYFEIYREKVLSGKLTELEANRLHFHEILRNVAKCFPGMEYSRVKNKDIDSFGKGGLGSGIKGHTTVKNVVYKKIEDFERSVQNKPVEHCLIVDEDGNEIVKKSGKKNEINFTYHEVAKMDNAKGVILTHSHPVRSSFSKADIFLAIRHGFKEIRAVEKEYTYIAKFSKKFSKEELGKLDSVFSKSFDKYYRGSKIQMLLGKEPHDKVVERFYHSIWIDVAKTIPEIKYKRVRNASFTKGGVGSGIKGHTTAKDFAHKRIEGFESFVKNKKIENCLLVDEKGSVVLSKMGDENHINFTLDEVAKVKKAKNVIFTHNHPSGNSFSIEDVSFAVENFVKEIRCVGSRYTHVMTVKEGLSIKELVPVYNRNMEAVYYELIKKMEDKEISTKEANIAFHHKTWEFVASQLSELTYERIVNKGFAKGGPGSGIKGHKTEKDVKLGKIYKSLEDFEKSIVFRHHEHCLVLDKNGKKLFTAGGDSMSITFASEQGTMLANSKRGFLTHNHPQPSSFSFADISTASKFHLQEIRVVTLKHLYQMRFKRPISFTTQKEIAESYRILMIGANQEYTKLLKKGMPSREISVEISHKIWVTLAKKYSDYLIYTKTERK